MLLHGLTDEMCCYSIVMHRLLSERMANLPRNCKGEYPHRQGERQKQGSEEPPS